MIDRIDPVDPSDPAADLGHRAPVHIGLLQQRRHGNLPRHLDGMGNIDDHAIKRPSRTRRRA